MESGRDPDNTVYLPKCKEAAGGIEPPYGALQVAMLGAAGFVAMHIRRSQAIWVHRDSPDS